MTYKRIRVAMCYLILSTGLFIGCIENDIPYPIVKAKITAVEVSGQEEAPVIDEEKRTVTVKLKDTTNIKNVKVLKFEYSQDSKCSPKPPKVLDLSSPVVFTLTTYQDYTWSINATQIFNREIQIEGQTGKTVIDETNKVVLVSVSDKKDLDNITITKLQLGPSNAVMTPDPATVKDFTVPVKFTVQYHDVTEEWHLTIVKSALLVETFKLEALWAKSATFAGSFLSGSGKDNGFEYKKSADSDWIIVDKSLVTVNGSIMKANIENLSPSTDYIYRAYLGDDKGGDIEFRTDDAPNIPNMDMNSWNKSGKNWCPWGVGDTPYWITGNSGVTLFKDPNTTPTDISISGKAAKLETIEVPVVEMAAGNLFTGNFVTNMTNPLDSPIFGKPFTGKPRKIAGMIKYMPEIIDSYKKKPEMAGKMDKGSVWIKLENWGDAVTRPDNPTLIAHSTKYFEEEIKEYTRFEMDIEYKTHDVKPTHITLVFSSSYLGDYYTGGIGSTLYVDDIEFVY